ncbi:MAG: NUDIX pyrophosphatase [Candidatus Marinimicrobia bacterium]|nr:NUDIX pyrophosphatase [Candidatus Neomarinimicrobiota bacterium]|tara:strand:+ start:2173 stop:2658 length:486 start_codon:yes stop_codon:yes gene_type:complete
MTKIVVRVVDAYVFIKKNNNIKFLILKRAKNKIYEHLWQGVAGKIEKKEKPWETAKRELKEETDLEPINMFVADHLSSFYENHKDRINLVPVFGIEVNSESVILSDEHIKYRWVSYKTAKKKLVWRGQKKGIKAVFKMLNSGDSRIKWNSIVFKKRGKNVS